ncbi:unnamed protein product [Nyctereutes procyonoides]|uniref:(raccoon dog) hypothetical protein n=1 Tax=Nyctereutes procyonoides TaxID=34880 RepID=A0A811Y824_NYCPR|nr:unnamed protein product [Nyctereutes procyonoides]
MPLPGGQDHWSNADTVKLLERLETNLPSNDSHTFKTTTRSQMDWGKVAFKDYSGEIVQTQMVTHFLPHEKISHIDPPQQYPKLRSQELTKLLSEKYRELPEQIRLKYVQDFQKEKGEFEDKLAGGPNSAGRKFPRHVRDVKSPPENSFARRVKFHGEPRSPREGHEGGPRPQDPKDRPAAPVSRESARGAWTGLQAPETESSEATGGNSHGSRASGENEEGRKEGRRSSDPSSGDADDYGESEHSGPSSSSPGHSSDSDSDSS